MNKLGWLAVAFVAVTVAAIAQQTDGDGPPFRRGRGAAAGHRPANDAQYVEDHNVFLFLLDHRDAIRRTVKNLPNGVETVTESDDAEIAAKVQEHTDAMYDRVEHVRPIHMRDPLFREIFAHAKKIKMKKEDTANGVRVTETSDDPYVAKLIQEHAKVVSLFIKNGRAELQRIHAVPKRNADEPKANTEKSSDLSVKLRGDGWRALPTVADSPNDNLATADRVELGKKLFFDPRLSLTGTVSCNSCHNLMEGGDDGRPSSMGIHGRIGPRNAPTVWNSVFQTAQFWDGRAASLEEQSKGPIVAHHEMGMPSHELAVERLQSVPGYAEEFAKVFDGQDAVNIENVAKAIAAFERTLITPGSPFDRFVEGDPSALDEQQVRGMKLFDGIGCTECHSGPALNGWELGRPSASGYFEEFPRSADSPLVTKYDLTADLGRYEATQDDTDKNFFKVPILRNVTLTAPYFHNGAVPTLSEAVRVMSVTQLDAELSSDEIEDIVAFLAALEGEFPAITLPHIPSRAGESMLSDQEPAAVVSHEK